MWLRKRLFKDTKQEKSSLENRIKQTLETPTPKYVFLSDVLNDNVFFQTFPLNEKEFIVLLSTGEYLEVIRQKIDHKTVEYFEYQGNRYLLKRPLCPPHEGINRPNNRALYMFMEKEIPSNNLFQDLCNFLDQYYDFYCEEEKIILAANIIHSYLVNAIGRTFYILLYGNAKTGKSTLQTVISMLQYNGCMSGKTSVPAMVRNIHLFQASQNIDELDKISKDEKKIAVGILNSGYQKNGSYEITNMNAKDIQNQIQRFYTFGTKSFSANKGNFDHSLLTRCITINTIKNRKAVINVFSLSQEQENEFQNLRNKIFIYSLFHWRDITMAINEHRFSYKKSAPKKQKRN